MPGPVDQCSTSVLAGLDVNVFDLMRLGRFVRQHAGGPIVQFARYTSKIWYVFMSSHDWKEMQCR